MDYSSRTTLSLIGNLLLFGSLLFVIVSTLTVFCTVSINKSLRKPSSYGILTVTFANLLFCCVLLFLVFVDAPNCGISDGGWCFFKEVVSSALAFLHLFAPVSVAIDRYVAICHPFLYMRRSKSGDTKWVFMACIIMSMLAGASTFIFKGIPELVELFIIFVALLIDITLYVRILFALEHHVSNNERLMYCKFIISSASQQAQLRLAMTNSADSESFRNEAKAAKTMTYVLLFYIAQWIPYFISEVVFKIIQFDSVSFKSQKSFAIVVWIAFFANACFDTMIFDIRVEPVKEVFMKVFPFCRWNCCIFFYCRHD